MRAVGVVPATSLVTVVAVDVEASTATVSYTDEWKMSGTSRPPWYAELRTRLTERLRTPKPDLIVLADVEARGMKHATKGWFETAEARGVLAEAAHSSGVTLKVQPFSSVTRLLNPARTKGAPPSTPAAKFLDDETYWSTLLTQPVPKKWRKAALLAIAHARGK